MSKPKAKRRKDKRRPVGRPPLGPPDPIPDTEANIIKTVLKTRTTEALKALVSPRRRRKTDAPLAEP